jgi:hypothetical protein
LDEGGATSFFESIDINSSVVFRYAFVVLLYCRRVPHDVVREDCFGAVDQEVWRLSRWLRGLSTQPPECIGQFLDPLASFGVGSIVQSLLESVEYHPIGTLDLSIGPRMGN